MSIKAHRPIRENPKTAFLAALRTSAIFAVAAWFLAQGPQPIQDLLRGLRAPSQQTNPIVVVRVPPAASQWTLSELSSRLSIVGPGPILDLTQLSTETGRPSSNTSSSQWIKLSTHWDGVTRSVFFPEESPVRSFADALGLAPLTSHYDVNAPAAPPEFHLDHLQELQESEVDFRGFILAYERDWTRAMFQMAGGPQDHAGLIAGFLNHPRTLTLPPMGVSALAGLSLFFLLLLQLRTNRTTALSVFLIGWLGLLLLPVAGPWGGLFMAISGGLWVHQPPTRESDDSSTIDPTLLPPYELPSPEVTWRHLCEIATHFGGALAAWAMIETPSGWTQVASSGDATPFDPDQLLRLRAPLSARRPEDRAYLALPVPDPSAPVGFLVIQPRDGQSVDPLVTIGGAMKLAAEQLRHGITPATPGVRLHGQRRALKAHTALLATLGPAALYDPLGRPIYGGSELRPILGTKFDTTDSLFETWTKFGGGPLDLPGQAGSKPTISTPSGFKIRLETGIHVGTIECYILRAVNQDNLPEGPSC